MDYICKCQFSTFNILEGAVRSGKTVDNVYAFAHEIKTTKDKFHLASGSTMGNAKLNIGVANGFGLENVFRGQCRWSKYKDNECLIIKGPSTGNREKIVIFAGAATSDCFKKIRGNSYGLWIATEINLHHDSFIKEAFNRQLAANNRKIFWDLNPDHPKAPIYVNYIDKYEQLNKDGRLKGGYNFSHMSIFDNINISQERIEEIISQYDPGSIWYIRDILGKRSIAEGLVYPKFSARANAEVNVLSLTRDKAKELSKQFMAINVGVDFGGNGSGHSFVATAPTLGYGKLICLKSEWHNASETDPDILGEQFVKFIQWVLNEYGYVTNVYVDSAEPVLKRGLNKSLIKAGLGNITAGNAKKMRVNDRIFTMLQLNAKDRFMYVGEDCKTVEDALSMAVWDAEKIELERLDNGTTDIDTLDALEYSYERDWKNYINADGKAA